MTPKTFLRAIGSDFSRNRLISLGRFNSTLVLVGILVKIPIKKEPVKALNRFLKCGL